MKLGTCFKDNCSINYLHYHCPIEKCEFVYKYESKYQDGKDTHVHCKYCNETYLHSHCSRCDRLTADVKCEYCDLGKKCNECNTVYPQNSVHNYCNICNKCIDVIHKHCDVCNIIIRNRSYHQHCGYCNKTYRHEHSLKDMITNIHMENRDYIGGGIPYNL